MVRFLRLSSRLSRAICLDCFVVGRRIAQLSCPKMLVLIAVHTVSSVSEVSRLRTAYHLHNMGTICVHASLSHMPSIYSVT